MFISQKWEIIKFMQKKDPIQQKKSARGGTTKGNENEKEMRGGKKQLKPKSRLMLRLVT